MDTTKKYKTLEAVVVNGEEVAAGVEVDLTEEQAAELAGKVEEVVAAE